MELEDVPGTKKKKKTKASDYPWHLHAYPGTHGWPPAAPYVPHHHPAVPIGWPSHSTGYQPGCSTGFPPGFPPNWPPAPTPKKKDKKKKKKKKTVKFALPSIGASENTLYTYVSPGQARGPEFTDVYGVTHRNWTGRTRAQIEEDDRILAFRGGAYNARGMAPRDAKPGELFWHHDSNGRWTSRNFATIQASSEGEWKKMAGTDTPYFSETDDDTSDSSDDD